GRSRDDVDEAADSEILKSWGLSASDEDFRRHGARHPLGAGFSGAQDLLPFNMDEQTALSCGSGSAGAPAGDNTKWNARRGHRAGGTVARLRSPLHGVDQRGPLTAEPAQGADVGATVQQDHPRAQEGLTASHPPERSSRIRRHRRVKLLLAPEAWWRINPP